MWEFFFLADFKKTEKSATLEDVIMLDSELCGGDVVEKNLMINM
jgi:hypothetical protein